MSDDTRERIARALRAPIPGDPDPAQYANVAADFLDALPERIERALRAALQTRYSAPLDALSEYAAITFQQAMEAGIEALSGDDGE